MAALPTRILIVDDHAMVRSGLRLLFRDQAGMEVVGEAADGDQAFRLVGELSPDVVIMDLQMPGEGGVATSRRIREAHPVVRVVVLTSDCSLESVHAALNAGVSAYLVKENGPDDLVRAVRAAVDGRVYLCPEVASHVVGDYLKAMSGKTVPTQDDGLTGREIELLRLLAEGKRSKEIAVSLGVETKSVEVYRSRLMKKLGCTSTVELARYAIREGIVKA
jgi:two-component system response regulator NreC